MSDINDAGYVASVPLSTLRKESRVAVEKLPQATLDIYIDAQHSASKRDEKIRAYELILEFVAPMCGHFASPVYELAFKPKWEKEFPDLYKTRWWINENSSGVYFIYDVRDELRYIGQSCGGKLGKRIGDDDHKEYIDSVDVILFDRSWMHYALAFEALAITRIRTLKKLEKNGGLKGVWIPPFPPWDQIWRKP